MAEITTTTTMIDMWSIPDRVRVNEYDDKVEFIYKQVSSVTFTSFPPQPLGQRVYKIVFSVVDGKWHKSEPIFGKIIPSEDEHYEFEV